MHDGTPDGRGRARRGGLGNGLARLLSLALVVGVMSVAQGQSRTYSDEELGRLAAGDVLVEDVKNEQGIQGLRATFLVKASARAVWDVLVDYRHYREVFTDVKDLEVLQEDAQGARVHFHVRAVWMDFQYTLQRDYKQPDRLLTWHRVEGDFKELVGQWTIQDGVDADHVIVSCESYVDIGFLVPTAVVRNGASRDMKITMRRFRRRLEGDAQAGAMPVAEESHSR